MTTALTDVWSRIMLDPGQIGNNLVVFVNYNTHTTIPTQQGTCNDALMLFPFALFSAGRHQCTVPWSSGFCSHCCRPVPSIAT